MLIVFYKTVSPINTIYKELTDPLEVNATVRRDFDIENPVLRINTKDMSVNIQEYNYAIIEVLERHYFVDALEQTNNDIVTMYLNCDYLETYREQVLAAKAKVQRGIKQGDYLQINPDRSVQVQVSNYYSDVILEPNASMLLSTIGE